MKSKSLFLFALAGLIAVATTAQTITSINIEPSSPTTNDNVSVIVGLSFPNSPCSKTSESVVPSQPQPGDTIQISGFYCHEAAGGTCTLADTFDLGQLAGGNYRITFSMFSRPTGGNCAGFALYAIDNLNFTVEGIINGINNIATPGSVTTFPNPVSGNVYFQFDSEDDFEITIYDTKGTVIKELTGSNQNSNNKSVEVDLGDLPVDIYFYTVKTSEAVSTGKFIIAR